jgi:polar amino acid transport system permease protein
MQFWPMVGDLAEGLGTTVAIFALTLLFSLPLGLLVALGRMSRVGVLRQAMRLYISVMRGTPLMLQLFFFYFGPYYLFGWRLGDLGFWGIDYRFIAVIIGFSLNYAAYFAEIYRAGIESIPVGQWEAGKILGFSRVQTFFRIILPQVVKRILPPVTNEVITLVKDTSLAFALSVMEMFTIAKMEAAAHTTMVPFMVAGLFYYVFNFAVAAGMEWFEKRLDYYK